MSTFTLIIKHARSIFLVNLPLLVLHADINKLHGGADRDEEVDQRYLYYERGFHKALYTRGKGIYPVYYTLSQLLFAST